MRGGQTNHQLNKDSNLPKELKAPIKEEDVAWEYILFLPQTQTSQRKIKMLCGVDSVKNAFHFNSEVKSEGCDREWMKKHNTNSNNQPEIWLKAKSSAEGIKGGISKVGTDLWFSQFASYLWHQEIVPKGEKNSYSCSDKDEEKQSGWKVKHCVVKEESTQKAK